MIKLCALSSAFAKMEFYRQTDPYSVAVAADAARIAGVLFVVVGHIAGVLAVTAEIRQQDQAN